MNKIQMFFTLCVVCNSAMAQVIDPRKTAERKVTDRANSRVDQTIDKGLDKVEEGVGNLFKKKDKTKASTSQTDTPSGGAVDHGGIQKDMPSNVKSASSSFLAYSKFDFVSGEKVLYFDNFDRVAVGDFPADFNTNASGEVVRIDGRGEKWLSMTKNGVFIPESIKALPDNFTLEFEVGINGDPTINMNGLGLVFKTNEDDLMRSFTKGSFLNLHPYGSSQVTIDQTGKEPIENSQKLEQWNISDRSFVKVALWRQKGRLRVYINESKLWDVPRFFPEVQPYFLAFSRDFFNDCNVFIANIKYAVGAPDTRNKLLSQGKFVTNGILFDINSEKIRGESFGVLKEIATVLAENPALKIRISGHTDSDGNQKSNLTLSLKRAASVKDALCKHFGVEASRIETDGFGDSKPLDNNNTSQGKANNRRVEFTKL